MHNRRTFIIAFASLLGVFGSLGSSCIPDPPELCGPEDLPPGEGPCDHYGEMIVGTPPDCSCVLFGETLPPYQSTGQVDVTITLPQGWTLNSVTGTINAVALSGQTSNTWATSQPVAVTGRSRQGNTITLSLVGADETFAAASELSNLKYRMRSTNLVAHATKPLGQQVHFSLPPELYFPVVMTDDCTDRYFDGSVQYQNATIDVEGTFDSPGC